MAVRFSILMLLSLIAISSQQFSDEFVDKSIPDTPVFLNDRDFKLGTFVTAINAPEVDDNKVYSKRRFEGDIINMGLNANNVQLLDDQKEEVTYAAVDPNLPEGMQSNAIKQSYSKWSNAKVPYALSSQYSSRREEHRFNQRAQDIDNIKNYSRAIIASAMDDYAKKTCVSFVPRNGERDYVYIVPDDGCYSMVGRTGGRQVLSLDSGCVDKGVVIHELMHSIGFFHEQSRPDRDQYITVVWDNIISGADSQFEKYSTRTVTTLDEEYDYGSVMHYSSRAFSRNGQSTIRAKRSNVKLGQRSGFSSVDLAKVNKLYKCDGQTGGVVTKRPTVTNRPNPSTGNCEDDRFDCSLLGRFTDMCSGRSRWGSMRNDCRQTCGLCREETRRPSPAATTRRPTVTSCNDQRSDCSFLDMFFDYCTDPRQRSRMESQCPATCGSCRNSSTGSNRGSSGRGSSCTDGSRMCRVAIMMDLCGTMGSNCRKTCGLC